jgi:DNA polymerase-1
VALDTETTSLDEMKAQIVGISLSVTPGEAAYIPLRHAGPDAPAQLPFDEVLARLKPWLEDATRPKLGQHVKYDRHVLANHGIEVQGYAHDTMLQSYVLEVHKPHGLASLAERHLGRSGISYEDLCGKGAHQIPFAQVAVDQAARYSCEDADQTLDVHQTLWPRLQAEPRLRAIYELEIASSEVLYRIERNGVLIDAPTLAAQSHELGQRIVALESEAYAIAGQPFNLSSPKQLGEIFFDKLGLPVVKKTATGARSTDEEVLEKLAEDYPLPAKILEHRSPVQAQRHLHRQARADGAAAHRPGAHPLCAGGGRDRAPVQQRPQPAEHPHPHRRRPAGARGLCGAGGLRDRQRRLQPDRAAHHGAPQRR